MPSNAGSSRPLPKPQRASADEREELLAGEVSGLQRRCAEAEARQQEVAARIPEATQPLMRQLEAMQAAATQQAAAWAEAERGLQERLRAAEAAAASGAAQAAQLGRQLEEAREQLAAATNQVKYGCSRGRGVVFVGAPHGGRGWGGCPGFFQLC